MCSYLSYLETHTHRDRYRVLILQHPHTHVSIGTIRLLALSLTHVKIIAGVKFPEILAKPHQPSTAQSPASQPSEPTESSLTRPEMDEVVAELNGSHSVFLLFPSPNSVAIEHVVDDIRVCGKHLFCTMIIDFNFLCFSARRVRCCPGLC